MEQRPPAHLLHGHPGAGQTTSAEDLQRRHGPHRSTGPDAVAWRRIERRDGDLGGSLPVSRDTFDALKARFEPVGPDEDRLDVMP